MRSLLAETLRWLVGVVVLAAGLPGCASHPPVPPAAIQLNEAGARALAGGEFEVAAARLALAIEYSPRFTEAWVNLGLLQLERGEREAARRTLRHARVLNPNLPAPHHALGLWAEAHDKLSEAEAHYRAALKVDPGFPPSRANLGRLLFKRAAWDEAREQFLRLTEVAPGESVGFVGLVESYLRQGRVGDGDAALDTALRHFPEAPEVLLLAARRQIRQGRYAEAERELARIAGEASTDAHRAVALSFLAVAQWARGDAATSTSTARAALIIDPNQDVARYVLAQTGASPPLAR
ncbi:MAG: tetratricopeptide repeat protein [Myxococcales bacterium]|nr:tetratricopeptide repeat protein [Myxococcales bacterium]